jgi:uncharacterized protein YxeA
MKTILMVVVGIFIGWYGALAYAQNTPQKHNTTVVNSQSVYTNKTGAVVGYSYRSGNQTTYVDKTGRTAGYEYRAGNQSSYVSPTGSYEGSRYRSWDTTDRYGIDPAQRGSRNED